MVPFLLFKTSSDSSLLDYLACCSRFSLLRSQLFSPALALTAPYSLATLACSGLSQISPCFVHPPPPGSLPLLFVHAAKALPSIPAACEKPPHPSRHSSNVTSFTKLSLIFHQPPECSVGTFFLAPVQQTVLPAYHTWVTVLAAGGR